MNLNKRMKIFLDIGHPAHVHYFKHLIRSMQEKGHSFVITARDKEVAHKLLKAEGIGYISRGKGSDSIVGKIFYMLKADIQLYNIAKKENPDLFLSFASPYCAQVSKLMGKPHITLDDTETATFGQMFYRPFSDVILTPKSFKKDFGKKQLRYPSFIELAYLHPDLFTPDPFIFDELGLNPQDPYVILRFVGLSAAHDAGQKGISFENKRKAIREFSKYARVFISSEKELPDDLAEYQLKLSPERIHHALAYAKLFFGESATMASESAMLGTPAIFVNSKMMELGTIREQEEKYGLVNSFQETENEQKNSIEKAIEILNSDGKELKKKREEMLKGNLNMTDFLESYLDSFL